ncbi:hypothetical protein UFOVP410_120 [uncultured Caudovirales phage]|uniref:Uncharacterized protein n=1 Tax=uncultured Caudovirales phage TaxID=2100421 RepID=A0A6J5M578_9CAUD|nr:hypothetical protein UFOVP410_120 [uncultured Caudovirales phage]
MKKPCSKAKLKPILDYLQKRLESKTIRNYKYIDVSGFRQDRPNTRYAMVTLNSDLNVLETRSETIKELMQIDYLLRIKTSSEFPEKIWIYPT